MLYRGNWRRVTVIAVALALIAEGLFVGEPAARVPDWVRALTAAAPSKVEAGRWQESTSAALGASQGGQPAAFAFPGAQRWDVTLGQDVADGRPVQVASSPTGNGKKLGIEVLDRAAASRAGASGFVFTVNPHEPLASDTRLTLSVDYAPFANAFGAGYADRLQVLALPRCVLKGCTDRGVKLPARNDTEAGKLIVEQVDPGVAAFAVTAGVGGDSGTFAATPLSIAGSWDVSPGSGAFTYSYPIDLPKSGSGAAPTLALGYSSASIDGMTLASNTQASPTGIGWSDFADAYIERRYEPCFRNVGTTDLCWKSDNATISLSGISGPMVPANAAHTEWKILNDPGWRIERLTGAPYTTIHQGQYWKVTGPDGTVYIFGGGHMPGRVTNSILAVPVLADNPGEPCRTPDDKLDGCDQGWRWYLDRVIDPDGNVTSYLYEREDNWYAGIGGLAGNVKYHRGALLKEIIYGGRGWDSGNYAVRVTFGHQFRCVYLVPNCPQAQKDSTGFPDVPTDLICGQNDHCTVHAPSFFVARRYSHVRTEVKIGNVWKPVAQHNIYHGWGGNDGAAQKLQITELQHAAIAFDKLNAYPTTKFEYAALDNRADNDGYIPKAMRHNRIKKITNPFGGSVTVNYGFARQCAKTYNPWPRWDQNLMDCFPQSIKDADFLRTGVFYKWLVTSVTESAGLVNGGPNSPSMTTSYTYEGTPAWAFDTGAFARDEDETGWSQWRGYGTTVVRKGSAMTRLRTFRGWDGDPTLVQDASGDWVPLGRRAESVYTLDNSVSYPDHRALAGMTLEERQYGSLDGVAGTVLQARRHEYEKRVTYDPGPEFLFDAEWVGLRTTTESVASAPGMYRQRRSVTTYNAHFQPTSTLEEGWLDVTGDERCSITTYAENAAYGMWNYPAVNKKVAGACDSTNVLTLSQTYYDGSTVLGDIPQHEGNATLQRVQLDSSRWAETRTEYDDLGRPVKITDPNGGNTTTVYVVTSGAPVTEIPIRTIITNALGHQDISEWHPEFGVAHRVQDPNGNVSQFTYDEFGRLIAVWLATEPLAYAEPTWRFSYDLNKRTIHARRLVSEARCCAEAVFEESWIIYDGLWRQRQVHAKSPVSGKYVASETLYDDRGLVRDEMVEQAFTGSPGDWVPSGVTWLNRTRHGYDELGREVRGEWWRSGSAAHATTTAYGVDTVTVTGPDGRKVRQRLDGLGRTVNVEEFDGSAWVSSTYKYDLADRLTSAADPAGNKVEYAYNMAGWRVGQSDPNRGSALYGYDLAGNQTVAGTGLGVIATVYDALNRPVERHADSASGPLLASWQYDSAPGGKGRLHKEFTYNPNGTWVAETTGYDIKGRVRGTKVTVPAGIAGLSGTYELTHGYDRADRIKTLGYPAIGGLPAEQVTTEYNGLGLPVRMISPLAEYAWGASFDDRGRRISLGLGPKPGGNPWMAKTWSYNEDQKLNGTETFVAPSGVISDHELAFDAAGNLQQKVVRQNGLAWRECYGYDQRARLTSAFTVATTNSCADASPAAGDRPYRHSYVYSPDAKLTSRVEDGATTTYTYPAAGQPRPHAPTNVGNDTYTWDGEGKLIARTVAGRSETLTWDKQDRLASIAGPGGTTGFTYDASGQRVLRQTPDGRTTLYLFGHEITVNASGTPVSSVRPYTFDGQLIATRTLSGVDYLVTDPAGSVEVAVPSGGTPNATRSYAPYGKVRAQTGDPATDRGFLGEVEDSSTGLSYLNARYYDAAIGVFISTDAVYDTAKPKTLNPYAYGAGSPVTFADPSGHYSVYTWGLEVENSRLKGQVKDLIAHIGLLNSHIAELQDVIRQQQEAIDKLLNYVAALEAEIARQATIIERLQARVAYLERVVVAQQREINRLRSVVVAQQRIIDDQATVIGYQRNIIIGLVHEAIVPEHRATVLNSIFSGNGIPITSHRTRLPEDGIGDPTGPVVPDIDEYGEYRVLGSRRRLAEHDLAVATGILMSQEQIISDLRYESQYHEARRDEYYEELHPNDLVSLGCSDTATGASGIVGGVNWVTAIGAGGHAVYCATQ